MSDVDDRIAWLDEHLPRALAASPLAAGARQSLELYLGFLDLAASDYQGHLSTFIELALAESTPRPVRELAVGRLLSIVHSLQSSSRSVLPSLSQLHDALSGTRKHLEVDFAELEVLVSATWALGFWSCERPAAAERRDLKLAAFGESVSDRLKIASGLPWDEGRDKAAAEADRIAHPIDLAMSDEEIRVACHALDVCAVEFDGNWGEFRTVFCVRSPGNLLEPCTHLRGRLGVLLAGAASGCAAP